MAIRLNERNSHHTSNFFVSRHVIAYSLGGGRATIVRSGIARLPNEPEGPHNPFPTPPHGFQGESRDRWRQEDIVLRLDLAPAIARLNPPPAEEGKHWAFDIEQWAPITSLNAIYNAEVSNNAGSSVRTFVVRQDDSPSTTVDLSTNVGIRDTDGYLLRVGYHVTLVGRLGQAEDPPPTD
jgi:hypothetical protein